MEWFGIKEKNRDYRDMVKTDSETKFPSEGEFDQGRLWYSRRGNVLTIGLTSRAIDSLGDLEAIDVPEEGDHFNAGDDFVTVEGSRGSIEVSLPTKGLVVEVNSATADLSSIADDPLEEGWLIKYQIDDLNSLLEL